MMNRSRKFGLLLASVACAGLMVSAGCEKKEEKTQNAPAPAPPPPPPKPRVSLEGLKLHPKFQFPDDRLPGSQEVAGAIAAFGSSIASGDHAAMKPMLSPSDQSVLATLVQQGDWKTQNDALSVVRVCVINEISSGTFQVGFGVQDEQGAFLLAWEATGEGSSWTYRGLAIEPRFGQSAAELDGAQIVLLGMPSPKAEPAKGLAPTAQKVKDESKDNKSAPQEDDGGGLKKDKF